MSFLYIVGSLCIAKFLFTLVAELYRALLSPGPALKKYGEWAVVTGATDGIGKAIAFELVRKGMHVLLISRSAAKLQAVKSELVSEHKEAMVETLEVDFSALSADRRVAVGGRPGGDVGVLGNNVGISYAFAQWFDELTDAEVKSHFAQRGVDDVDDARVLPACCSASVASSTCRLPRHALRCCPRAVLGSEGHIENLTRSLAASMRRRASFSSAVAACGDRDDVPRVKVRSTSVRRSSPSATTLRAPPSRASETA